MLYRKFGKTGETVSILGFGCMRLPLLPGGDTTQIDEELAVKLIRHAIDSGVTYIDTAYPYHGKDITKGGESEPMVAKALKGGYREKVKLATKLPNWLFKAESDGDKYLDEQLERLGTDHIDFYLSHNINSVTWQTIQKAGLGKFMDRALQDGRIKHAGFSFHDKLSMFKEAVDYYDWSFCQIQYNYIDEGFQAGKEGLEYAAGKGLGIVVMEPLRGGKLAVNLPVDAQKVFEEAGIQRSPANWALRWVWNNPEVAVVLSGMNSMDQLTDNLQAAAIAEPNSLSPKELDVISRAKAIINEKVKIRCTTCGYCMPCPTGVNIPGCFGMYNNFHMFGKEEMYNRMIGPKQRASNCIECGICEEHCPQGISIRQELKHVKELFE